MSFAYTETDRIRITDAVSGQSDFLNTKDCKQQFRELERLKRKTVSYDLHLRTLAEYIKMQRIPRGLRVRLYPTLFAQDKEFCQKWEAIVNKCSNDLILATMEQIQKELPEMERAVETEAELIRNSFPAEAVAEGTSKLTDHLDKFRVEVEARKRSKFQRDAADYASGRVYRWANNMEVQSPPKRSSRTTRFDGEDHHDRSRSTSASTSSSCFLGGSQVIGATPESGVAVEGSTAGKQKRAYRPRRRPKRW
ncbi:hypothetical protein XELAEV_18009041mg [Xenopus laevis]|uniref:Uncharacterized protein n=1 Tax=Xenopus laevis TaxID=8355 RepID=A0A974I0M2_XENLA|nr:hypothetical protein XELAEV_18009041mg [Xenopus laevis]